MKRKYPVGSLHHGGRHRTAKGYADKYTIDGRHVTNVDIAFSSEERNINEWKAIAQ